MASLLPPVQAAVRRYDMIAEGDRIAVGVSGGKDSVALLALLAQLRTFYPIPFSLTAITLDPCFDGPADYSAIADLCEQLEVPYILKRTHLWDTVVAQGHAEHPCSLCARMRRGALHKTAREADCNVVALGHHLDDAAETFWMNLTAGSTLGCFSPKTYLDRSDLTLIRPLLFLTEKQIAAAVRHDGLPVVRSACPADGASARQQAKEQLKALSDTYGDLPDRIVSALQKSHLSGW
ncbi:MAG: tRNA 2-thiocytidine biosynthesis protein TtcA [Clostridia bacterium]|nr:tRNA 2-thiocytidine biosynthesis protein TtcA [Clostridia bacterium]